MDSKLIISPVAGIISVIAAIYCNEMQNYLAMNVWFSTSEQTMYVTLSIVFLAIAVVCLILTIYFAYKHLKK